MSALSSPPSGGWDHGLIPSWGGWLAEEGALSKTTPTSSAGGDGSGAPPTAAPKVTGLIPWSEALTENGAPSVTTPTSCGGRTPAAAAAPDGTSDGPANGAGWRWWLGP